MPAACRTSFQLSSASALENWSALLSVDTSFSRLAELSEVGLAGVRGGGC
jgi:hypothetical protein